MSGTSRGGRGGSRRGRGSDRPRFDRKRDSNDQFKHPGHLKGREIGMFYRNARSQQQREQQNRRPLGTILLSDSKKQPIETLLNSEQIHNLFQEYSNNDAYNHVKDSRFKREFLRIIQGNINDKILKSTLQLEKDSRLDEVLYNNLLSKQQNVKYKQMLIRRQKLPSYDKRKELLRLINDNQVVVISGETGCGKTTQVAQFILDDYIEKQNGSVCKIICTQPRRISAISVAERVAQERAESLGVSVGYQIRLERTMPRNAGSICFCTTGVVLKLMESDPALSNVSHLILDEIHERDVMSDFLITILKHVITHRKDLKLILMSATLNSEAFSKYYNNAPHINIPGFTYPVQEYFLEDVLQRTKFTFPDENIKRPNVKPWMKHLKHVKQARNEFSDVIEPHIRQLEAENKYDRQVLMQLRNQKSEEINLDLILALIINICTTEKDEGAILVFLTGFGGISKLHQMIEESGEFPRHKYLLFPLHSQMPTVDQRQIFEPAPAGKRKIIISTNIAETSITIDDVVFVIDCGKIKMSNFDSETNTQTLQPEWVSLANASQRKGRAGRVQPGICFHLFSKGRFMMLDQYQKPEILRKRLEDVILTGKLLQLGKIEEFFGRLIDAPDPTTVHLSLELLKRLNALDDDENLTPLGYHLAKLPIGPQMGKMVLFGAVFSCLDPILSVAASLDFKDAFQMPVGKQHIADKKKIELSNGWMSDHLLLHQALHCYENSSNPRGFCYDYFLSRNTLNLLQDMKKQFMNYLYEMKFVGNLDSKSAELNLNSDNLSLVKAVISAGLYPNVAVVIPKKKFVRIVSPEGEKLKFHPKSVLNSCTSFDSSLLVYYLKLKSTANFIHDATLVHPLPIVFFGDNFEHIVDNNVSCITINKKIRFKSSESTSKIIKKLRDKLSGFLEHKIAHPGLVDWRLEGDEIKLLRIIMDLITSEEMGDFDSDAFDDYD